MRKSIALWSILVLVIILGIALIDASVTRPIDWRKTFNVRDKIPFGLFVFHEELPNILGTDRIYQDFGDTFYEEISRLDSAKKYDVALIHIDEYSSYDEEDIQKIIHYAHQGGEVFIAALYLSPLLMDTLGIHAERIDYARFLPNDNRVTYSLAKDTARIKVDKVQEYRVFSKLQSSTCTVLGHLHSRGRALPNFVRVSVGKGNIYLHSLPDIFTNYHILRESRYDYVAKALHALQHQEIFLADSYYEWEKPRTPLRVILTQPGFYQAWYLLLIGLLLLLVFKSKREQRALKVIKPEPNLSKEFAHTIGNLYYENGHPGNIIHKKIDYFLFMIRSLYHLETWDILDDKFLKHVSLKSGVAPEETKALMQLLESYRKSTQHQLEDVKIVNNSIEDFKQKAQLI